jgi:nucleoside-diphosphate-sugar epimerase
LAEIGMRIVVIGGTGFLGYFTCRELLARGHSVVAVGLRQPEPGSMPHGTEVAVQDANTGAESELDSLLRGADVLIHAAGADGRNAFPAPAINGFRRENVEPLRRLIPAMRRSGTGRLIIFGSYYTALARSQPQLQILERNAYPRSRAEQADLAFRLAGEEIGVSILELPYIFGAAPGRGTLWGFIMGHVAAPGDVTVPAGGSACVTANQVAQAAAGAVEGPLGRRHFPIGGENLTYGQIYRSFAAAVGVAPRFVAADRLAAEQQAVATRERLAASGQETGYDPVDVAIWQSHHLYLDPLPAMEALGFGPDDINAAIAETVRATQAHGGQGPASFQGDAA